MLVLDSGAVTYLSRRTETVAASIRVLVRDGLWPPVVPTVVLVESLTGRPADANANRLLKTCDVIEELPDDVARRAAELRYRARRGSAVDAILVASAEPGGTVLSRDVADLKALAAHAEAVTIQRI